ncbi:uncharacterized protein LOC142904263 isoform X4 [Nelusetta ayraudi]|uniref:uncharacterized protein LOC142904263 isoform X4 n=1 Tax=Nelusetta ayraudi TaxID=303726 RepID=UPI003F6E9E5F
MREVLSLSSFFINMKTVCVSLCLLSAVSFGSLLNVTGRVGEDVEFLCSGWKTVIGVKRNDKYFCHSPCTEDEDIIVQAPYGGTQREGRISITNSDKCLVVRFTNLQIEDTGKYSCAVKRLGWDDFIEVNVRVLRKESDPVQTTLSTTLRSLSPSPSLDTSSSSDGVSEFSTQSVTNSRITTVQELSLSGSVKVIILLASAVVVMATVTLLLLLLKKKKAKIKLEKEKEQQQVVHYDGTRPEDQQTTGGPAGVSLSNNPAEEDHSLYASCTKLCPLSPTSTAECSSAAAPEGRRTTDTQDDLVYTSVKFEKLTNNPVYSSVRQAKNPVYSEVKQFESSSRNDDIYSLAQRPQVN